MVRRARTRPARRPVEAAPEPAAPPSARGSFTVGLAAFVLYALLTPGVAGDKDSSEFTLVLAKLGSAHPTGYPIYTLLGHAWVALLHAAGIGWDRAANLWSAAGGGLAIALLHALAARWLAREGVAARESAILALLPAAAFGLNPLVTAETTLAEVNAFHLAWVALAALAVTSLLAALARGETPATARFARLGLLAGVGLAHHVTSVLVTLPLGIAVLAASRAARVPLARALAAAAVAAVLPLAAYGFIAWRAFHPNAVQWASLDASWPSVWAHVTGAEFRLYLGHWSPAPEQASAMARSLWPWLWPLVVGAFVWAARATPAARALRWGVAGALVLTTGYGLSYGVPDPASYFLPALLLASAAVPSALAGFAPLRRHGRIVGAVCGVLLLAQGASWVGEARERGRAYTEFEERVHAMWQQVPFDSGFVMWMNDMVNQLHEFQILRGERPHVEAMHPIELTHDRPRQSFLRRHGFDPASQQAIGPRVAAFHPGTVDELSRAVGIAVAREVNDHSPLPVLIFMPERGEVRLLEKSSAPDTVSNH